MLIITAADAILIFIYFSDEIKLGILCELSARQSIHMNCQLIFLRKVIKKTCECDLLKFVFVLKG